MGKSLIQQARGKGGPVFKARSFANVGESKMRTETSTLVKGKVIDILKCPGHFAPRIKNPASYAVAKQRIASQNSKTL